MCKGVVVVVHSTYQEYIGLSQREREREKKIVCGVGCSTFQISWDSSIFEALSQMVC